MIHQFAGWLSNTRLSVAFQNQLWVVPTSQSIHILAVSMLFASAVIINLRLLGVVGDGRKVSQVVRTLVPWMWRALIVLLVTGAVQTIAEPLRQFVTPFFWAKMVMILIVTLMTAGYARAVRRNAPIWDAAATRPPAAKLFAMLSTLLWLAIMFCGRFIAYTSELYT